MTITCNLVYDKPSGTRIYTMEDRNLCMYVIDRFDESFIKETEKLKQHSLYFLIGSENSRIN